MNIGSIILSNGWASGFWKKALKNGLGIAAGVALANFADSPGLVIYSGPWFRHMMLTSLTAFIVTELTYVRNWAHTNGNTNGDKTQ